MDEESFIRWWLRRYSVFIKLPFLPVFLRWRVFSQRVIAVGFNGLLSHVDLGTGDVINETWTVTPNELSAFCDGRSLAFRITRFNQGARGLLRPLPWRFNDDPLFNRAFVT